MPDGSPPQGSPPKGSPPKRTSAGAFMTLANIVTFARLCAVPLAFWLVLQHRNDIAFLLFVAAGLSDALDGWLARRFGGNAVGALLDPIADKALIVTMYVTLAAVGTLPVWLTTLVVFRDLIIVGGVVALAVLGHAVTIHPLYISKLNTVVQILLVAVSLLESGFSIGVPGLMEVLIWCVAGTTLASGAAYVWNTAQGG